MMKTLRFLVAALAIATLTACSGPVVKLGNISSRDEIDTGKGEVLSASSSGFQLLLFIPIATNSRQERAWQSLREQAGNRLLGDVKVTESWSYGFVGTIYTTTIEATAYPRRQTTITP